MHPSHFAKKHSSRSQQASMRTPHLQAMGYHQANYWKHWTIYAAVSGYVYIYRKKIGNKK
jgi:hypothetical protein